MRSVGSPRAFEHLFLRGEDFAHLATDEDHPIGIRGRQIFQQCRDDFDDLALRLGDPGGVAFVELFDPLESK